MARLHLPVLDLKVRCRKVTGSSLFTRPSEVWALIFLLPTSLLQRCRSALQQATSFWSFNHGCVNHCGRLTSVSKHTSETACLVTSAKSHCSGVASAAKTLMYRLCSWDGGIEPSFPSPPSQLRASLSPTARLCSVHSKSTTISKTQRSARGLRALLWLGRRPLLRTRLPL